ncbi:MULTISPECIES: DegV family protein [Carnobacterium]|uniref:DegV family protein n=1 Tax=Carnobacterium divergens TaxID=2748 RepID=A0A2R7ZY11_CARDV|nr:MULTISPECIES: DegV family protein [Carnobacterium]MCO6018562.1 DegV family protein [Carnobacterium divergens]MDT1939790.1 DegV family protein [Carnobacterium divergens]MDT1942228.1 DegV family protein [Carnobacterium divergens]MDT1948034.1 DegV family protein [Carnobacterium divergens]MDT1950514.1 DegV family protein [Carnobacterium divergens]
MKIAIVTDSTAYLTQEQYKQNNIYMLPLSVVVGNEVYREEVDITSEEFFEKVRNMENLPTSSQPTTGEIVTLFEQLAKDYDAVISIHLSSKISGTYQNVAGAASMVEGIQVFPYDSGISCMAQGYFALEGARMAKHGATVEGILTAFEEMQKTLRAYFMVDDLNHLVRGGRLSNGAAILGSMLKIKPILHFEDKEIVVFEKIRSSKKALKRIEGMLVEDSEKGYPIVATIIHANAEEEALKWKKHLEKTLPTVRFELSYFGPVIGTHLGEGALGMAWIEDRTRSHPY